jgi:hypothetical protein
MGVGVSISLDVSHWSRSAREPPPGSAPSSKVAVGPHDAKALQRRNHMTIENLEMIVQHEISARSHARLQAVALVLAIAIVVAAIVTA